MQKKKDIHYEDKFTMATDCGKGLRRSTRLTGQLANDPRVLAYVLYSAAQRAVPSGKRRHGVSREAPGHKGRRRRGTKGPIFLLRHSELGTLTGMLQSGCG